MDQEPKPKAGTKTKGGMNMIIRGIEVYRINELSAKVQREVFYREIREICDGFYYKWWDYAVEDMARLVG
jgi:hypothetical protein